MNYSFVYFLPFSPYFIFQSVLPFHSSRSVLKQVHRLFQSQFSTLCDLVLPISNSGTLSFPYGHPVYAYVFLVSPSLISFLLSPILTW